MIINKVLIRNFKCHQELEVDLKNLNVLTGGNASGKSSVLQGILLAHSAWKGYEGRRVSPNDVQELKLGIPDNLVFEEFSDRNVAFTLWVDGIENEIKLQLLDDEISFYIENAEDIACMMTKNVHLGRLDIYFLKAERQGPRLISNICDSNYFSVGNTGENTSYVIGKMDKVLKLIEDYDLPEELKISEIDRFSAHCEEWLKMIIPDTEFQCNVDIERNISTIKFKNNGEFYLPTATGFGITYVLPIIVQALVASVFTNSVLIIENPEAHLHPYSQSVLGKFLALVAANGVQIILETHSEHIIDGCRIQSVKNKKSEAMKILFFEKAGSQSTCRDIGIQKNGELTEWPEGFFDQKQSDLRELLEMRRCGK